MYGYCWVEQQKRYSQFMRACLQLTHVSGMLQLITNGAIASYVPRLLGVYPVISNSPQLREFANTWKNHGSVKQLQVAVPSIQTYTHN